MHRIAILIAALALAACESPPPSEGFSPPTTAAYDAAAGERFAMYSIVGIGDIVLGEGTLTTSDGQALAIRPVAPGVWAFDDPPSELTNGEDFCFSQPVTHFTWHRHQEGLWAMNVGAWASAPALPAADTWAADGGCGLFTYEPVQG